MSAARGNPAVLVRVDQDTLDKAQEAFPPVRGRSGGVAYALRRLLHVVMDEPIPKQYGEVRRSKEIDDLEAVVRRMEAGEEPTDRGLLALVGAVLAEHSEAVDILRLRAVAGRLALLALQQDSSSQRSRSAKKESSSTTWRRS